MSDESRRQQIQNELARKAIWLAEINKRKDGSGYVSQQAADEAAVAAGIREPAKPKEVPAELRLMRLEEAEKARLTLDQAEALTGTTREEIQAEIQALTPPGEGGARTNQGWPTGDPSGFTRLKESIREAEAAGEPTGHLKAALLLHETNQPRSNA
jgi:hypothetical protein